MILRLSKIQLCLIAVLTFISSDILAQEAPYGSLGLRRIYQSTLINPVLVPDSTSIENSLSFFPFIPASPFDTGMRVDVGAFNLGSLTSSIDNNGNLNMNLLVSKMNDSKNSNLFAGANISLLHVYFKVGKKGNRIEISQRLKASASTNILNKNTFGVFINDDDQTNRAVNLTDSKMQSMAWNEIAFGYTTNINKNWTVGVKAKYLTGVAYADFSSKNLTGTVGPDGNSFNIDSQIRTASLDPIANNANGQDLTPYKSSNNLGSNNFNPSGMLMNSLGKNMGLAMDAGVKYKASKTVGLFAGFNDLGYIQWKSNPLIYSDKGVITDFYPVTENQDTKTYQVNFDAFTKNATVTPTSFTTYLHTHLNSGATWQPTKTFHSTLLMDAYLINGAVTYPGATIAGTLNGGKFSEITLNAGYNKDRPFRVGMGGSLKLGVLQMHLFTSNMIGLVNPKYLQSADVQFGLSWVWRHKEKNRLVQIDNSTLDTDKDGVADKVDTCIDLAGPVENHGCPWGDTDGDTVLDKDDACVAVAGPVENKGCPWKDTDGDTVLDKDDSCIAEAGPVENKGCPWKDTDGDTVLDKDDACIAEVGSVENKGCPWKDTDGDTVLDKDDACIAEAGSVENKGCPWKDTDGDTVLDKDDSCIDLAGTVENKGCPQQVTKALVKALEVKAKSIFFNSGKATFRLTDNTTFVSLDTIKEILANYPEAKFSIEGYTDNVGSLKANLKLSQQRANAVRNALISRGIDPKNLVAKGFGAAKPVASNKTEKGREQNRRTVIKHVGNI